MTNFEFLEKYLRIQSQVMYDEIKDLGFAKVTKCNVYDSPFWNLGLVDTIISKEELSRIEETFKGFGRISTLYFEKRAGLENLVSELESKGYKFNYADCWMFYEGGQIDTSCFDQVKKVETERELEIFLKTFDDCYKEGDPQNPYGTLDDYLEVAKNSWLKHHQTGRLEYFIAYKGEKSVAVGTLNNFEGIGYISNVGSLQEVRGEGFGKLVTLYCVEQSKGHGNKEHALATEEGTYPNEFYQRIGFSPRFVATAYTKE